MEVIHYHIAETTTTPTKMTTEIMNTTYPTTTTTTTTMMTPTKIMEALIDNATTSIIEPMDDQWTTNGRPMEPIPTTTTNDTASLVSIAGIDWMEFQNQALVILAAVMAITAVVILVVAVIVKRRLGKEKNLASI